MAKFHRIQTLIGNYTAVIWELLFFIDLTFKGRSYVNSAGKTITFNDMRFTTVLCNVDKPKIIIKTNIQGRNGSVKEYIGDDDYHVTINGIITGGNGHYPADEVRALKEILDAPVPIEVVSRYLQNMNIYNLVVTDYAFEQVMGEYSQQNFSINCISDDSGLNCKSFNNVAFKKCYDNHLRPAVFHPLPE